MKKLYTVNVACDFDMYVVADNESGANTIARRHAMQELRDCDWLDVRSVKEAVESYDGEIIPWGEPDDDRADWTVAQYLAEKAEKDREAEEQRRIEANQLKLPLVTP